MITFSFFLIVFRENMRPVGEHTLVKLDLSSNVNHNRRLFIKTNLKRYIRGTAQYVVEIRPLRSTQRAGKEHTRSNFCLHVDLNAGHLRIRMPIKSGEPELSCGDGCS